MMIEERIRWSPDISIFSTWCRKAPGAGNRGGSDLRIIVIESGEFDIMELIHTFEKKDEKEIGYIEKINELSRTK